MLQKTDRKTPQKSDIRVSIVASVYNSGFVDGMIEAALTTLAISGAGKVELIRVPGAFEIPVVAAKLAKRKRLRPEAILCLGVILRGKTAHADHVGHSVTQSLARIAVETGVPMIHEVLLLDSRAQAKARCLSSETNRGTEAAHTALAMINTISDLN